MNMTYLGDIFYLHNYGKKITDVIIFIRIL